MRLVGLGLLFALAASSNASVTFLGSFEGHDYYVTDQPFDVHQTRLEVGPLFDQLGVRMHLAAINSAEEDAWLRGELAGTDPVGQSLWWIGLTDETTEGSYTWDSGEDVIYTAWAPAEPSGGNVADYAVIGLGEFSWLNVVAAGPSGQAVQGVIEVVPEPGTMLALAVGAGMILGRRKKGPYQSSSA